MLFNNNYALDLGTDNTIVYAPNRGIIYNEPTYISINNKSNKIIAIGDEAKSMVGKNHKNISVIAPLKNGAISDLEMTTRLIKHLVDKEMKKSFIKPTIAVSVPFDLSYYEKEAVAISGLEGGAKKVMLIQDPYSAGIGADIDILSPKGALILDFGSGVVEVSLLSCGSIVASQSIRFASKDIEDSIISYIKEKYRVSISHTTAEKLKINSIKTQKQKVEINSKSLVNGLPQKIEISTKELSNIIYSKLDKISNLVKSFVNNIPLSFVSDVYDSGIYLTGGGSLLCGFREFIEKEIKLKANITNNPLLNIAMGAGKIVEDKKYQSHFLSV
jgi:rod shape-determining protein MreB